MKTKPIIDHFSNYLPLNEGEIEALTSRLKERKIKRRQFILSESDVCKHYTFVVEGCFKMYKVDDKGQEHNLQFAIENEWISDRKFNHNELYTLLCVVFIFHLFINCETKSKNIRSSFK